MDTRPLSSHVRRYAAVFLAFYAAVLLAYAGAWFLQHRRAAHADPRTNAIHRGGPTSQVVASPPQTR